MITLMTKDFVLTLPSILSILTTDGVCPAEMCLTIFGTMHTHPPETGDDNGVRAAWLGAAAVLAAAIPAVMLTVSRRKKKYIDM